MSASKDSENFKTDRELEDFDQLNLGLDFYTGVSQDGSEILSYVSLDEDQEYDVEQILAETYNALGEMADEVDTYTVRVEIDEVTHEEDEGYLEHFESHYLDEFTVSKDSAESMLE